MLYTVLFDAHPPSGAVRDFVVVDAETGDDAASKGAIAAAEAALGGAYKIVGVYPADAVDDVEAVVEGDDAPDDQPKKRKGQG